MADSKAPWQWPNRLASLVMALLFALTGCITAFPGTQSRITADDALEYVRRDGSVIGRGTLTKIPVLNIDIRKDFYATSVSFPVARMTDEMVEHLAALDSLQTVILLGEKPGKSDAIAEISTEDIQLPTARKALATLQAKRPQLKVYANPISEFRN
ncbi:MAG: hypothetical protein JWM11_7454 [Planctomycetaceae bacterium]|nr:hypothetical protein [Planctomycetaceae bacterium]